jgi:protein-tyrosine phosphatase
MAQGNITLLDESMEPVFTSYAAAENGSMPILTKLTNFRDFGGRTSLLGGVVCRDRLFRCGQIRPLTPEQCIYLAELNFDLVIDLRHEGERARRPVPWPLLPADKVLTTGNEGYFIAAPHKELLRKGPITSADVDSFYDRLYRQLPFDTLYQDLFARGVVALSKTQGRALIYCTAGKDRTGMFVALVQHALGVHLNDVIEDYLISRESSDLSAQADVLAQEVQARLGYRLEPAVARRLMSVKSNYVRAFFESIEQRCGSVINYLADIGVSEQYVAELQMTLLDPLHQ